LSDIDGKESQQPLQLLAQAGAHVGIPPGVHAAMGPSASADELK
jgi:hypothetical protein